MSQDRNEKPHLLIAKVEVYGRYRGIAWSVTCPYAADDMRNCGVVEACTGSEADVAKFPAGGAPGPAGGCR